MKLSEIHARIAAEFPNDSVCFTAEVWNHCDANGGHMTSELKIYSAQLNQWVSGDCLSACIRKLHELKNPLPNEDVDVDLAAVQLEQRENVK